MSGLQEHIDRAERARREREAQEPDLAGLLQFDTSDPDNIAPRKAA